MLSSDSHPYALPGCALSLFANGEELGADRFGTLRNTYTYHVMNVGSLELRKKTPEHHNTVKLSTPLQPSNELGRHHHERFFCFKGLL